MKNLIISFITLICSGVFVIAGFAQGETRLGFSLGVSSATITGPDVDELSPRQKATPLQGIRAGVFVNSKIRKNFWVKSELHFIQKGAVLHSSDAGGNATQTQLKSRYIEVYPFSPTFTYHGFQVLAGPYVSMLLTASVRDSSTFGLSYLLQPYRQKIDAGFVLGFEYDFRFGLNLGVRYTRGFVPLYENTAELVINPSSPYLPLQNIYNECLSFSVGYSLHARKDKTD